MKNIIFPPCCQVWTRDFHVIRKLNILQRKIVLFVLESLNPLWFSHKFWETCEVCHWGSASFKLFRKWIISDEINVYEWYASTVILTITKISWLMGFCNQWALLYLSVIFQYFFEWGFNMWFKMYWNIFFNKMLLCCFSVSDTSPYIVCYETKESEILC